MIWTDLNITRLECKDFYGDLGIWLLDHLNITRLECKGYYNNIRDERKEFEYNQIGM